jgi:hypothetical protein
MMEVVGAEDVSVVGRRQETGSGEGGHGDAEALQQVVDEVAGLLLERHGVPSEEEGWVRKDKVEEANDGERGGDARLKLICDRDWKRPNFHKKIKL